MAPNLPPFFIEDVRLEIIDETQYSDNEIYAFCRKSINRIAPLIQTDATAVDGTSIWDFNLSKTMDNEYWEVIKWATICYLLGHYKHKLIAEGVGVSIGIGSERIDTKSLLLTTKEVLTDAKKVLNQKILAYNMTHRQGVVVDLYIRDIVW